MYRLAFAAVFIFLTFAWSAEAQGDRADSLIKEYRFEEALQYLGQSDTTGIDSLALMKMEEQIVNCRNGLALTRFVSSPTVIAKKIFHKTEFIHYLPLKDGGWRFAPNSLVHGGEGDYPTAFYYPDGGKSVYFTDKDEDGKWSVFHTDMINDTLWSYPERLGNEASEKGDRLYPMLSPDGKSLYFASNGLYGIGGYDLYVSRKDGNTGKWGPAENLGFPFSTPYNDIFFAISEDERYQILVSDRDASGDSVTVYIMEYEPVPVRKEVPDPERLANICRLDVHDGGNAAAVSGGGQGRDTGPEVRQYLSVLDDIRKAAASTDSLEARLKEMRSDYRKAETAAAKGSLYEDITEAEAGMSRLRDEISLLNGKLGRIEMGMLAEGIPIPTAATASQTEEAPAARDENEGFVFSRHAPGGDIEIMVSRPVEQFDYSFRILPTGRFAENNNLPDGLVYQIQIFASASPAGVKHLNGLSPVFMRHPSAGKYIYSVGLFGTYEEARSNLGKVKSRGFGSAFVTAYLDGEKISTTKAREMEKTGAADEYAIYIAAGQDGNLDEAATQIIKASTPMDIIRTSDENGAIYMIGPFKSKTEAEAIAGRLIASDIQGVSVEKL